MYHFTLHFWRKRLVSLCIFLPKTQNLTSLNTLYNAENAVLLCVFAESAPFHSAFSEKRLVSLGVVTKYFGGEFSWNFCEIRLFSENLAKYFSGCHTNFYIQHLFHEVQYRNGHAWTCTKDMDMYHGQGPGLWTWDMHNGHGHGHAVWTWSCSMDMDTHHGHGHGHAAWTGTCSLDMYRQHEQWTCTMDMNMVHGHGHAPSTWMCNKGMEIDMHPGHEHVAWTWKCSMAENMFRKLHAAWTLTFCMNIDMDISHGRGHVALTQTCRMDIYMQHEHGHADGHGHAAWTWTYSNELGMQHGHWLFLD